MHRSPRLASLVLATAFPACVQTTTLEPPPRSLLPTAIPSAASARSAPATRAFVGLDLEEPTAQSLEQLEIAEGLTVARVTRGSPAEAAGVVAGDRVMSVDGAKLERLDQWQAILDAHAPGSSVSLSIEHAGALRTATLAVATSGADASAAATCFAERVKLRAILESVSVGSATAARIVELLPQSPLAAAGVAVGDRIVALDAAPVTGAADVVRRVSDREYGDSIALQIDRDGARRDFDVELWSPPRVLTGLAVPILFRFDRDIAADKVEFALVDLWIIALYDYRREGFARRHRILRFFRFESGEGRLTEEGDEPAARARSDGDSRP